MRLRKTKQIISFLVALMLLLMPLTASAEEVIGKPVGEEPMYQSFIYTYSKGSFSAVEAPAPYRPVSRVDTTTLGVALGEPVDIFALKEDVYIVDKSNNQVVCTDASFKVTGVIKEFKWKGKTETFKAPEGVYATADKVYVADTGNRRIVVLNKDGSCSSVITTPKADVLAADLVFAPQKVAADGKGRVYAVVQGVYEGIMELYEDGSFGGFVGSIPVSPDPFTMLWKSIASKEQRDKLENFIPVEYTNLSLDKDGFVYTVSLAAEKQNSIRRLNAAGGDILNRGSLRNIPVSGILEGTRETIGAQASDFLDIVVDDNDSYYALDGEYGRIFGYDSRGNLLFVFGGKNTGQNGTFQKASAMVILGDKICVADSVAADITVFERTDYANEILRGIALYEDDKYEESIAVWNEVLRYNSNFVLAYSKIGQCYYQLDESAKAMTYFKKAMDQDNYSLAFTRWREEAFSENFGIILVGLVVVIVLLVVGKRLYGNWAKKHPAKPNSLRDNLHYPFYVIFHPIDGFWDLKYEKRGKTWVSTLIIFLTIIAFAMERGLSGFAITATPDQPLDIMYQLKFVLVPLALFIIANLSITTLMDGKGTFKQIYIATGYVLLPLVLVKIPLTIASNLFAQTEAMYVALFNGIAIVWVAMLLFCALMCTHEYTAAKTVWTVILTAIAMVIICFICVLFFFLFSELIGFVYTVFQEIRYR